MTINEMIQKYEQNPITNHSSNQTRREVIGKGLKGLAAFVMGTYIALSPMQAKAEEYKEEGWKVPDVSSAEYIGDARRDLTPRIRGKETTFEIYKKRDGTHFNRVKIKGKTFCYTIAPSSTSSSKYNIWDYDGDGLFELKTGADHDKLPEWVLK